jgi:hypothetical protein
VSVDAIGHVGIGHVGIGHAVHSLISWSRRPAPDRQPKEHTGRAAFGRSPRTPGCQWKAATKRQPRRRGSHETTRCPRRAGRSPGWRGLRGQAQLRLWLGWVAPFHRPARGLPGRSTGQAWRDRPAVRGDVAPALRLVGICSVCRGPVDRNLKHPHPMAAELDHERADGAEIR